MPDVEAIETDGPLRGLRVVELGVILAGPFVGRMLGDFGAEVIKVEAPGSGDPMRDWGATRAEGPNGPRALWWPFLARNKNPGRDPEGLLVVSYQGIDGAYSHLAAMRRSCRPSPIQARRPTESSHRTARRHGAAPGR